MEERSESCYTAALKTEEGAMSQGKQVASRSWKRKNPESPPVSRRNTALCTHFRLLTSRTVRGNICVVLNG